MITPGLVSVTFRKHTPADIVAMVAQAGLASIEWGGDVHVPHGETALAREVAAMTIYAGLAVAAYGSYYRSVDSEAEGPAFESVLETAVALGAPTVRVWAGRRGSGDADAEHRQRVIDDSLRIADLAASAGVTVSFEFHGKTLTDTNASAEAFYAALEHPAIRAYWQPAASQSVDYRLAGLRSVAPRLTNVHVFQWNDNPRERRPLAEGAEPWRRYLQDVAATGRDHGALIEFVAHDAPEQFLADAQTLKTWLTAL